MSRALCLLVLVGTAFAHDPITTRLLWTQEISRLVYKHCATCHHEGGAAMSLMTYDEARPWAKSIRDEVLSRRMPPWGPVKGVGEFRNDPSLSQIEIDMIVNWVEGGAPKGDDIYLPPEPSTKTEKDPPPTGHKLTVNTATPLQLNEPVRLTSLHPLGLSKGESLELTAVTPGGGVQHLIWIRNWRPEWERFYYFLRPVGLPKGTRLALYSGTRAEVELTLAEK